MLDMGCVDLCRMSERFFLDDRMPAQSKSIPSRSAEKAVRRGAK